MRLDIEHLGSDTLPIYLEIEDLTSNALFELMRDRGERFVSYKTIEAYGKEVAKFLGERTILLLNRDKTNSFYESYPSLFEEREVEGIKGVFLREGKTEDDLRRFRGYLPLKVLLAFCAPEAKSILGITTDADCAVTNPGTEQSPA